MPYRSRTLSCLGSLLIASAVIAQTPEQFANLSYRSIGPSVGGRTCQVAGIPGDPLTYYVATASGGVWKSTDAGHTWNPIFDDQSVSACGSIAVAESDPNVIYVGTGEGNPRGNVAGGNGIYKSTDAGQSWTHVWNEFGHIGDMAIHPKDADVAYAAVLGHVHGPNRERGVYRTTDGGSSWERVLFKNEDTGACDLCLDPNNPRIIFAAMWQMRRQPWNMTSGGPGSDLHVSRDGGDTWTSLKESAPDNGLPEGDWGKIGVAVAPSDSRRVYALIEAHEGGLFRSDDGGESWERINEHKIIRQRAWYFSNITAHPTNRDIVFFSNVPLIKSVDGGKTLSFVDGPHHVDHHHLWIDPKNPARMIDANDGGVDITLNGGETWVAPPLPICQFYHINCDNAVPYRVMGNMQDMGTASGPSNSLSSGGITLGDWVNVGGGETGFSVPDPKNPDIVYSGEYGGYLSRFDRKTGTSRNVSPFPWNPSGITPAKMNYRFQWTAPVLATDDALYHAANVVFRSRDGGQSWEEISPDLTRDDEFKQQWSGGPISGDNTGVEIFGTVFAPAASSEAIWAGTDDGRVHVSRDDGGSWTDVTANVPHFPDWGTVACIEASPHQPGTAFLVVDRHRLDDRRPYLWKTSDFGTTWFDISKGLTDDVYLHAVREDPTKKGLLFVGTERGVSYSPDGGETWHELKLNLPTAAVHDLHVHGDDLVVGTHGRSIWILDDITPIRQWSDAIGKKPSHLFEIRPATRWHYRGEVSSHHERAAGENPPVGAMIQYQLKEKPSAPIQLAIFDKAGQAIALFDSEETPEEDAGEELASFPKAEKVVLPAEAGVNRFAWDLRHFGSKLIPRAHIDWGDPSVGPLVSPGEYTVKLTVNGKSVNEPLVLKRDPRFPESDVDSQEALSLQLRAKINTLADVVAEIRLIRKQLESNGELLAGVDSAPAKQWWKRVEVLRDRLDLLERKLHNPDAKVGYDIFLAEGGAMLYSQFALLYEFVAGGEGEPTKPMYRVAAMLDKEFAGYRKEYEKIRAEVEAFNAFAKEKDLPRVWVPDVRE